MTNQDSENKSVSKNWLQHVTEQSWEPELLISGLAIYATIQMPDLFLKAYNYYQYNLQAGSGIFDHMLPLLIYSVFTSVAYILMAAFITHFVIRAFWVGFIGLMSVYKDGIQFDELPYSELLKEEARKNLGTSEYMAMRLDQISSLIFSIAFAIVLLMVGVAFLYLIFFLFYNVSKLFLDPEIFDTYADVLSTVMFVSAAIYVAAVLILNMKRFRSNPRLARWHFNLTWRVNSVIMPIVHKPLQHIQLTFLSNMSNKKFVAYYLVLFIIFFGILISTMLNVIDPNFFDSRDFFATRSSARHVKFQEYSSNATESDVLKNAVIDHPVVSSRVMEVFIPYPKRLDVLLNKVCEQENVPDSLDSDIRRRLINEHNITCAEQFFSFSVDDSLEFESELMFTRHHITGQEGFQSYLSLNGLTPGRHRFFLKRVPLTKEDSTEKEERGLISFEVEIPFWIREE